MSFTNTLSDDELFHLMLHSDINTITSICLTRTISYCTDEHFWKLKFGKEDLPILTKILPTTLQGWRKEYIRVDEAATKATDILNHVINKDVLFDYSSEQFNFKNILPLSLRSAMYNFNARYNSFTTLAVKYADYNGTGINKYRVVIYNFKDRQYYGFDINVNDIYDVLTIVFYYYPNINYQFISVGKNI